MADACVANTNNAHAAPAIAYNFIEPSGVARQSAIERRGSQRAAGDGGSPSPAPEMVVIIAPRMPSVHRRENIQAAPGRPFAAFGNGMFLDSRVATARWS